MKGIFVMKIKAIPLLLCAALLTGCATAAKPETVTYSAETDCGTLDFTLPVSVCEDNEGYYDIEIGEKNVTLTDNSGNTSASMTYNHSMVGGQHASVYGKDFSFDVLTIDSGKLFAVYAPIKTDVEGARALTLYYFDEDIINFVGKSTSGDYFPVVVGSVSASGDVISYTEVVDGAETAVSFTVNFENGTLA